MQTAKSLAEAVGAKLEGDGAIELSGVAAPERAGPHDLIYVEKAKHAERAVASAALCVIAAENISLPGKTVLRSSQAKVAFAKAAALILGESPIASGIHPTAIVAPLARVSASAGIGPFAVIGEDAHVGEGTQIGAHSVIGAGCWIGERCRIHPRVTLYAGVRLGHRVEIHSGAVIGADGFGYAEGEGRYWKFPQAGIVQIADDVEIGANTTIDRGSLDDTRIAEGVKLDNLVHVGHNCQIGRHVVVAAQTGFSGGVVVEDYAIIGGQVGIGDKARIEAHAVLGSGSGVLTSKIVRGGQVMWGTPARPLKEYLEQLAVLSQLAKNRDKKKKSKE